ncbi:MAG: ATP-binding protein, partial [Oscillospiraceae bacterium]|nr:ATP-binding protein [Oscillospiraceae bacterium]
YLAHPTGWVSALGSVCSGKTHICTAICGELLNAGVEVRYFRWADDSRRLKSLVREPEVYQRELEPYKRCKALYIDDVLKTKRGTEVTAADINLAFELIDYRYSDSRLITILSSEKQMDELLNIDEALGSRIYERTKGHLLKLTGNKNWRTR